MSKRKEVRMSLKHNASISFDDENDSELKRMMIIHEIQYIQETPIREFQLLGTDSLQSTESA